LQKKFKGHSKPGKAERLLIFYTPFYFVKQAMIRCNPTDEAIKNTYNKLKDEIKKKKLRKGSISI
jgi:hypothetical protein